MAIWTQSDFDNLKAAYLKLAAGEKVVQVSIGGKFVRYQDAQIEHVRDLLSTMAAELGLSPKRVYAKPKGRY